MYFQNVRMRAQRRNVAEPAVSLVTVPNVTDHAAIVTEMVCCLFASVYHCVRIMRMAIEDIFQLNLRPPVHNYIVFSHLTISCIHIS